MQSRELSISEGARSAMAEQSATQDLRTALVGVRFEQKWNLLKPTIERLYISENLRLSNIIEIIKEQYGFDATDPQYKYQIKKWKLKKSTSTTKKAALYQTVQKRATLGKSSAITRAGQKVDTKNLRRYLKNEARKTMLLQPEGQAVEKGGILSGRIAQFGNRVFMNWNMPYGAIRSASSPANDHVSPLSDFTVATPPSPRGAPSPMAMAVREMTTAARARLLARGRHDDLFKSMQNQQKITMSMWMYQYWLFSFKTAKYWGRGPLDWTADVLGFENYHQRTTISFSSPNTPAMIGSTPPNHSSPDAYMGSDGNEERISQRPSIMCRWSIHCNEHDYVPIPAPPDPPRVNLDLTDERHWPEWQRPYDSTAFTNKLSDNLRSNNFSNIAANDIPIAVDQIAGAAQHSTREFKEEALGFGIMSGNSELVNDLLEKIGKDIVDSKLYPFHLAISHLKGSKDCCLVLEALLRHHPPALRKLFVNDLGHTVLDQVMMAILKAHTSCRPSVVDSVFKKEKRFEGEDVDICGRWDADSDCMRTLLAEGVAKIPFEWKHVFCHTSAQTICHCIGMIYGPSWGADVNSQSGLFIRRCLNCGLKMELKPLHALVLTGLHLCLSGSEGETLFGLLAVLLCLLRYGANPLLKSKLSLQALLGNEHAGDCDHEELYPIQLAEKVPDNLTRTWSDEARMGWQLFCNVLRYSHAHRKSVVTQDPGRGPREREKDHGLKDFMDDSEDELSMEGSELNNDGIAEICDTCGCMNFFGDDKVLPSLWAAVQTELLTYRRLKNGDGWVSHKFDMAALTESFRVNSIAVPFLKEGMMKPFCECGEFRDAITACPTTQDATTCYFSNLEDWNRSNFINCPETDHWWTEMYW